MPAECVPKFKQYLSDVGDSHGNAAQDPAHAADATNSYQALDASRECRDAIRRIADANKAVISVVSSANRSEFQITPR